MHINEDWSEQLTQAESNIISVKSFGDSDVIAGPLKFKVTLNLAPQ